MTAAQQLEVVAMLEGQVGTGAREAFAARRTELEKLVAEEAGPVVTEEPLEAAPPAEETVKTEAKRVEAERDAALSESKLLIARAERDLEALRTGGQSK